MSQKGWKVVYQQKRTARCHEDGFFSINSLARVKYVANIWTAPDADCGPLCVFDTRDDAVAWMNRVYHNSSKSIWMFPCEYTPSHKTRVWDTIGFGDSLSDLPQGTRLATRIRILQGGKCVADCHN